MSKHYVQDPSLPIGLNFIHGSSIDLVSDWPDLLMHLIVNPIATKTTRKRAHLFFSDTWKNPFGQSTIKNDWKAEKWLIASWRDILAKKDHLSIQKRCSSRQIFLQGAADWKNGQLCKVDFDHIFTVAIIAPVECIFLNNLHSKVNKQP